MSHSGNLIKSPGEETKSSSRGSTAIVGRSEGDVGPSTSKRIYPKSGIHKRGPDGSTIPHRPSSGIRSSPKATQIPSSADIISKTLAGVQISHGSYDNDDLNQSGCSSARGYPPFSPTTPSLIHDSPNEESAELYEPQTPPHELNHPSGPSHGMKAAFPMPTPPQDATTESGALQIDDFSAEFAIYAQVVKALLVLKPPSKAEYVPNLTGEVEMLRIQQPNLTGRFSTVYKGIYQNQYVAIKAIRQHKMVKEPVIRRRFWREAKSWWCLDHKNILRMYGVVKPGEFGPLAAMISPWCDYGTATEYLESRNNVVDSVKVFCDVAHGIQYLHECTPTVIHGDLKPSNVLIDSHGEAKLCDFGLLRLIHDEPTGMTTGAPHSGTPRYLSIELVNDDFPQATTASDIHALGCVGMEFIYSCLPYASVLQNGQAEFKICTAISNGNKPASRPPNLCIVVSQLWDYFDRCWNSDPTDRPKAREVSEYLDNNHEKIVTAVESDFKPPVFEPQSSRAPALAYHTSLRRELSTRPPPRNSTM